MSKEPIKKQDDNTITLNYSDDFFKRAEIIITMTGLRNPNADMISSAAKAVKVYMDLDKRNAEIEKELEKDRNELCPKEKSRALAIITYLAFDSRIRSKSRPWVFIDEFKHIADDIPSGWKYRMVKEAKENIEDGYITDPSEIKEWQEFIKEFSE